MAQEVFRNKLSEILGVILDKIEAQKILLITGKRSFVNSGADKKCGIVFKNRTIQIFSDFTSNPSLEEIQQGIEVCKNFQPDVILSIGGGSAMDIAKAITVLSALSGDVTPYIIGDKPIVKKAVPLIAVPTTAGSGSEATHFAVVYIGTKKYSLAHSEVLPDFVILDSELTYSLSPNQVAISGLDALAQAIESYWSINSTDESKQYSAEAISIILQNLQKAVAGNLLARDAMLGAAHLAGKAINIAKTTAAHALSYVLTSNYGIPHGQAVFLTLPSIFIFNSKVTEKDCADIRGVNYVNDMMSKLYNLLGVSDAIEAKEMLTGLIKKVGLTIRLSDNGVPQEDMSKLAVDFSPDRAVNNPRIFTKDVAMNILSNIF